MGARLLALQALELQCHPTSGVAGALADEALALARDRRRDDLARFYGWHAGGFWSAQTLELRSALATELAECAEGACIGPATPLRRGGV